MPRKPEAPTWWHPLPAQMWRHGKHRALLDKHGASGPYAFVVLLEEAAARVMLNKRGHVAMSWGDFRLAADIRDDDAGSRLRELADMRLVEIVTAGAYGFEVRILHWGEWDQLVPNDPGAAARKRAQRERESAANG